MLTPETWSWASYAAQGAVVLVGACLQGIGGIGFAMFAAPIAALFFPALAPGPLLFLGGSLSLLSALRESEAIDWPAAASALAGRVPGTLAAVACMAWLPASALAILFALMILAGVVASQAGWKIGASRTNVALAGVASGLMGTITSAGAPPFAIVMQHLPPARLRATLGCVFFAGAAFSLAMLASVGRFGMAQLWLSVGLLPLMLLGFWSSGPLNRRLSRQTVRRLLLALSAFGAIGILVKEALT